MTDERRLWIRLTKTGLSARKLNQLLDRFGGPAELFAAPRQTLQTAGVTPVALDRILDPELAKVDLELELMDRLGVTLCIHGRQGYPVLLGEIPDPPPVLYVRGALPVDGDRCIAIVGSRHAGQYGKHTALRFGQGLSEAGFVVVSGMALGVDTSAHEGALRANGRTVACLGCGVDVPYPYQNRGLMERIRTSGALVSEYPPGSPPDAWHFPSRNRIISGLSLGVVVIEAPEKSGSLITVRCAVEQNREVFAVPGNIDNPRNRGAHALIRDGACLVQDVQDVVMELTGGPLQPALPLDAPEPAPLELNDVERRLYDLLGPDPLAIDDLILESGLPASATSSTLFMLEMKGAVRRLPGNAYVRAGA